MILFKCVYKIFVLQIGNTVLKIDKKGSKQGSNKRNLLCTEGSGMKVRREYECHNEHQNKL